MNQRSQMRQADGASFRAARSYALQVALPLFMGSALYLFARPDGLRMFGWARALGLGGALAQAREQTTPLAHALPGWTLFSLPDALWAFAFARVMGLVWRDRLTRESAPWLLAAPVFALGSEVGQALHVVPGTFDATDLACLMVGVVLGLAPVVGKERYR
jgi:hypothetical protein